MKKSAYKKISIAMPVWILDKIIGNVPNRSARIEELIMKGFLAEKGIGFEKNLELDARLGILALDIQRKGVEA